MCYTIAIFKTREELENRFNAQFNVNKDYRPNYHVSAFQLPEHPVICNDNAEQIEMITWGLIPFWVKNPEQAKQIRMKTFNAKAETITEKPSFRNAVKSKKCLVLVDGFFEWHHYNRKKYPYFIRLKSKKSFALAGIYDDWQEIETSTRIRTFSVITTEANEMLKKIHNTKYRMPVILDQDKEKAWIDSGMPFKDSLKLLAPFDEEKMIAHPVSGNIAARNIDKNNVETIMPFDYSIPSLPYAS